MFSTHNVDVLKTNPEKGDVCLARAYTHHRKFVFVNSIIADMESMETLYKHGLLNEYQNFFFSNEEFVTCHK